MKLNPDCIREILLAVEEQTGFEKPTYAYDVAEAVNFPLEEVLYHINQCELYGYFSKVQHYVNADYNCKIIDLSPKGHEFLRNIRSENVWEPLMKKISPLGTVSLSILEKVASGIILKMLIP